MGKTQCYQSVSDLVTVRFPFLPVTCSGLLYDTNGDELASISDDQISYGFDTTVSGSYGVSQSNRRTLGVNAPTTGLSVGTLIRIVNAGGQEETAIVRSVPSTRILVLDQELACDYTTGDTVEDPTCTFTMTPTQTEDLGTNYRVRFIALDSDGNRHYRDVLFDVVTHKLDQPITSSTLRNYDPMMDEKQPASLNGTGWSALLEVSWDAVYEDFVNQGIRPSLLLDEKQLARLHLYKFKQMVSEDGIELLTNTSPLDATRYFKDEYTRLLGAVIPHLTFEDKNEDLAPSEDETNTNGGTGNRPLRLVL